MQQCKLQGRPLVRESYEPERKTLMKRERENVVQMPEKLGTISQSFRERRHDEKNAI